MNRIQLWSLINVLLGVLLIVISLPLFAGKIQRNHIYGFRFEKAFESHETWLEINRYGAKWLIYWSSLLVLIGCISYAFAGQASPNPIWRYSLLLAPTVILVPVIQATIFATRR